MPLDTALFIDPPSHHFLKDRLFDPATAALAGDDINAPYRRVREVCAEAGIPVHTIDALLEGRVRADRNVCVSVGMQEHYESVRRLPGVELAAFFAMECPIVEPKLYLGLPEVAKAFRRVYSWSTEDALLPFTKQPVTVTRFQWPQSFDAVHNELWRRGDRKFLVMINANKLPRLYVQELYTRRLAAVAHFERYGEIDLFGKDWNQPPHRVGRTWVPWTFKRWGKHLWEWRQSVLPRPVYAAVRRAWRGPAASKSETLSRYTFTLCFENMIMPGWMTEKLFDCFFAGTVPIYLGAPDVTEFVPASCFIDAREFQNFEDLRGHLKGMSPATIGGYREAARAYLESKAFDPFRKETFARRLLALATTKFD
jgi:hypothetical protein